MVDLTLFHPTPDGSYPFIDRLNSRTGFIACYFLEWTGWYNNYLAIRLLGHYRLFQLFKKDPEHIFRRMSLSEAYILHYQSSHAVKYFISRVMSFLYSIFTLGHHYHLVEIETFNKSLIREHAPILKTFLDEADDDFTSAFHKAMAKLKNNPLAIPEPPSNLPPILIQVHKEDHHYHQTFHSHYTYNHSEINFQPAIQTAHKGKEKDVLSKKQVLIFLDLLSSTGKLEAINFSKPAKFEAIAALLHAFTGRSITSWIEELNNYRKKDLYAFRTQGELKQLIADLTNLASFLRNAGFRSIASLADKKIRELEQHRKDT